MGIYYAAWALLLLPAFGAAASFLAETARRAAQFCVGCSVVAVLVAAAVLGARLTHPQQPTFQALISFFTMSPPEGSTFATRFTPQLGVAVDSLSAAFAFAVSFVVALVQVYALTTLRGDAGYRRFFWTSSLLSFTALGLVLSPNLFDSAFAWILGSAAVYLLASHWWDRGDAAAPARRSLVTLQVGDVALLIALVVLFAKFGVFTSQGTPPAGQSIVDPFAFDQFAGFTAAVIHGSVGGAGVRTLAVLASVLIFAVVVRAAQLVFHVWLADATTAPTPAFALLAVAGAAPAVYLVARVYPLLLAPLHAISALAFSGAVTAVLAAAVCLAQRDVLRVVVVAVVAELGLALTALGTGGYGQGMFVLFTTLMAAATGVIVAGNLVRVYRTRNIMEMGGAWRRMRTTRIGLVAWALAVGGMSLNTYYTLSAVFANAKPSGPAVNGVARTLLAILIVVAALTLAVAAARVAWHVLAGDPVRRRGFQTERIAEVERPLRRATLLASLGTVAAVVVGLPGIAPVHNGKLSIPGMTFTRFVYESARPSLPVDGVALLIGLGVIAIAAVAGWLLYAPARRALTTSLTTRLEPAPRLLARGLNLERYAHRSGRPFLAAGTLVARFDDTVLESLGDTVMQAASQGSFLVARLRAMRSPLYLAGGLAVAAVLALLSILAATGHFWIHSL
ncbi:MAG: proton-conducting transporter membrane subunit [Candidatus Dormibacteria bacterium]